MKHIKKLLLILLTLFLLCGCKNNLDGPYLVERVVDGDTFITNIGNKRVRVRALCIDTPESVAPDYTGKTNTSEGEISSNRAKELLENKYVYLEYDEEKYDQYDRILAYVYLQDKTSFEEIMIPLAVCLEAFSFFNSTLLYNGLIINKPPFHTYNYIY